MAIVKLLRALLIIFVFLATFFPVYVNISAFARENIDIKSTQSSPLDLEGAIDEYPKRREVLETIKGVEQAIKEDPTNRSYYEMLAFLYDYIGEYRKSLEAVKKQIEYYPENGEDLGILYGNLARQYLNLDRLDEAKPAIDKSLEHEPDNLINRMHALQYYILKEQYHEAGLELNIMTEYGEQWGLDRDFYYEIFTYFFNRPDYKVDMVKVYKEAVKVNPSSHLSHRTLAIVTRNTSLQDIDKNFPVIMKEFNKALKLNSEYVPTYIAVANTYLFRALKTKDNKYFDDCMKWLDEASKLEPNNLRLGYAIGNALMHMELYDKAIKKLEYVIDKGFVEEYVFDRLADVYNAKAYSFYEKGKNLEEALDIIDKAIKLKPKDGVILSTKAEILYKMKRLEEAYEYIKEGIKLEPNHTEMKQDLVNIEKALKEAKRNK
ncbi:tetratricopeptide repeat protein [Candidatus Omnitrophota bacterium]